MRTAAFAFVVLLLAALVPAPGGTAATGDVLARYQGRCLFTDPSGVELDGDGRIYVTQGGGRVHRMNPDGRCDRVWEVGVSFRHLAWDTDRGVFWGSVARDGTGTLYTWDPESNAVQPRFSTNVLGEGGLVEGLAYHPASGTLWVGKGRVAGHTRLEFDPGGTLLQRHVAPADASGLASDGVSLWEQSSNATTGLGPHRLLPPAPGEAWPAPDLSLRKTMYWDLAFDPVTFAPRCGLWGTVPAWPSFLQVVEVPCPAGAVGDAWTLSARGDAAVREHGRAFTRLGAAANASADVRLAAPGEGLPGASLLAGRSEALALRWPLAPVDGPRAEASSTVGPFEVPGLVAFASLEVRAMSAMGPRGSSSQAQGVVHGLRIGPFPPRDLVFDGAPITLDVPGAPARVTLFAIERHGDGERSTGLRVAGLRLVVDDARPGLPPVDLGPLAPDLPGGQLLEVGVAWTGASTGGALPPHPALRAPFDCGTPAGSAACEAEAALAALG